MSIQNLDPGLAVLGIIFVFGLIMAIALPCSSCGALNRRGVHRCRKCGCYLD